MTTIDTTMLETVAGGARTRYGQACLAGAAVGVPPAATYGAIAGAAGGLPGMAVGAAGGAAVGAAYGCAGGLLGEAALHLTGRRG